MKKLTKAVNYSITFFLEEEVYWYVSSDLPNPTVTQKQLFKLIIKSPV